MKGFIEFNKRDCIKNNLISSSVLIFSSLFSVIISSVVFIIDDADLNNPLHYIYIISLLKLISTLISIIASLTAPLLVSIYKNFLDNIKSLSGLWLCSIILGIVSLSQNNININFFIFYIFFVVFGSSFILICKYLLIKKTCNI